MEYSIYIDTATKKAFSSLTSNGTPLTPGILQTHLLLKFYFFSSAETTRAAALLDASTAFRLGLKPANNPTGDVLIYTTAPTSTGTDNYTFEWDFIDSAALQTLLGKDEYAECHAEIEWTIDGVIERVAWPMCVFNANLRSTDGPPDPLADASYEWLVARLVAGTNVTLTADDIAKTITISSSTSGAGTGDVVGPASATDNAITIFDATTGKLIQSSGITIADGSSGTLAGSNSGDVTIGTANGLALTGQSLSLGTASALTTGALTSGDWGTFNSKQDSDSTLTALSGLADAAGVLTNNGSGTLSYTATSSGGNTDGSDQDKLVKYGNVGSITAVNTVKVVPYFNGAYYSELESLGLNLVNASGNSVKLQPPSSTSDCIFRLPSSGSTSKTLATEDGNIAGTAGGLSSTLVVASGGTGQTSYTDGQLLIGNSTGNTLDKATLTAGSGISITNGAGSVTIAATGAGTGTVTSIAATVPSFLSVSGSPITTSGTLAITLSGTALPVANGGTGITSFGTGIATALGVNIGSAGAPVLFNGDAGTPSAIVLTNASGTAAALDVRRSIGTDSLTTTGSNVTVSTAAPPSAGQVLTATSTTAATWQTPAAGGKMAQSVYTASSTPASTTATFPGDNTIPQNTEGAALSALDTTITPTNAGSTLLVRVVVSCGNNAGIHTAVALFRDNDADAIQSQPVASPIGNATIICFEARVPANSTSATTFKIRYGGLGACTMYVNTYTGTQYLGGATKSTVTVTEILP